MSDTVRDALGHAVREVIKNSEKPAKKASALSGTRGLIAGAGLAAAAPIAKKGVDALRSNGGPPTPARMVSKAASKAGDKVGSSVKDAVSKKVDEAGGAGGIAKQAASGLLPGGDDDDKGGNGGMPGVGKGRRMPIQQAVDVAVPLETAYNQWTQYEDWPNFMHRVTRVTQEDEDTVSFATKIWGKTKEFEAKILLQIPDDRIKWTVSQGITHTGVVSFHELAPKLTRLELTLDVEPGSLIEKAARGMRHIKRAVRADLARYKAFIEMQELETGAWRGVIIDGEVVEDHDESYDEERDYSDVEDIYELYDLGEDGEQDEDSQSRRTERFKRQAEQSGRSGRSRTAAASRSSSSRSASSKSGSSSRAKSSGSKSKSGGSKSSGSKSSSSRSSSSRSRGARNGSSRSKASSSKSGSPRSRGSSNGKSSSSRSKSSSSGGSSRSRSSSSRS